MDITFEQIKNGKFELYEGNPIVKRFGLSTIVADPSVLTPDESDGKWHLFCHTIFSIQHFESEDGINFKRVGSVVKNAMRPDVNKIGDTYYLYYEKVQNSVVKGLSAFGFAKWFSEIYLVTSKDLKNWSKPKKIVGKEKPYHTCELGTSISNPFLIKINGKYRLYYSSALSYLEDCHFSEPTYLSWAEGDSPDGVFTSRDTPFMSPCKDNPLFTEGCGCIKVYALKDRYIGLINGIYTVEDGSSRSAIMLFESEDGETFNYVKNLVEPQTCGNSDWMAQYVYASSLVQYGGKLYLYFNARDTSNPILGREHIGLARLEV